MKKNAVILLFVLSFQLSEALVNEDVRINEIMYNPDGDDNNREFVEIFGTDNLTNYAIGDEASNDSLALLQFKESNYSLIVEEGFDYSDIDSSVYSAGPSIGNGLGNSGDTIYLYFEDVIIDKVAYDRKLADGNGKSMEYENGNFRESQVVGGTPGRQNSEGQAGKAADTNQTNEGQNNESNNKAKSRSSEKEKCNVTLNIEVEKQVYDEGEKINFRNNISDESFDYVVSYWIEDIFHRLVREEKNTSNSRKKQFTPQSNSPGQAFFIRNKLEFINCSNTASKVSGSKLIVVRKAVESCIHEVFCRETNNRVAELERELAGIRSFSVSAGGGGGGKRSFIPTGSIESFYTRKKSHDPKIKLFSKIRGNGIHSLRITSHLEEFNKTITTNKSETLEIEVNASPGRNLYLLELIQGSKVVDIEKLVVEFYDNVEKEVEISTVENNNAEENAPDPLIFEEENQITTGVIYESKNSSSFLIGTVLLAIAAGGVIGWKSYVNIKATDKSQSFISK